MEDSLFINDEVLAGLLGQEYSFYSVESIITSNDPEMEDNIPIEYVNSLTTSRMPPDKVILKQGAIAMLLINPNTNQSLTNCTRLIIKKIHTKLLEVEIVTGSSKCLLTKDDPHSFRS